MEDNYKQVSCSLYDGVESLAVIKKRVKLVYINSANEKTETENFIADVFSKDKAEYIRLGDGSEIRLDKLIEIDGKLYSNKC
mgnify:CR=1 FL=1